MKQQKNIAILTNFHDFNPGYSLSGIVVDQSLMLLREGHKVFLYTNEQYNPKYEDDARVTFLREKYPDNFFLHHKTKFMHLKDYKSLSEVIDEHKMAANEAANIYCQQLSEDNIDVIYTHDFIFTGWNVPYALAVKEASRNFEINKYACKWFHWIHSVPTAGSDWWQLDMYGKNHFVVFPNRTEIQRVAENYRTSVGNIKVIPHIKDPRTWYDFGEEAIQFTELYPRIMSAEIVKIYPTSTDRMFAKQVDSVLRIFGFMKKSGRSVFLVIANQWATARQPRENVDKYVKIGEESGLVYGEDFVFTSKVEIDGKFPYEIGISRKMLRELQLLSSLFIFPTVEESFGLIGPEAALSGALCVINRSLSMMLEIMGTYTPSFDFGSHHHNHKVAKEDDYLKNVALAIINRLLVNEAVLTKMRCRCIYNMDNIYQRYYEPITLN